MKIDRATETISFDKDKHEPGMRSCWTCNPAHEHFKNDAWMRVCFSCGRYYFAGRYMDEFETFAEMADFIEERLSK